MHRLRQTLQNLMDHLVIMSRPCTDRSWPWSPAEFACAAFTKPRRNRLDVQRGPPCSTGTFAVLLAIQHRCQGAIGPGENMAPIASSSVP